MSFRRRTPLAWRNITHQKMAMLISVAAVSFAVLIMFMELGFLNGLYDSQTGLMRSVRADLVMVSSVEQILVTHETFSRARLEQAAAVPGVKRVCALYTEDKVSYLRHPQTGVESAIRVIGFDLDEPVFDHPQIERQISRLRTPRTVLFDRKSRHFFGPIQEGTVTELAHRQVTVVGTFDLGTDYYYDGNMVTSTETFFELFPNCRPERAMVGLITLDDGVSAAELLPRLRRVLSDDVEVMTREEIIEREKRVWRKATPAGYVFGLGVIVGFIIGVIICYQILYTDIMDHLPQIATMKAMGYQNRALVRIVLQQAVILGLLGFLPAVGMSLGLYSGLTAITGIVMRLTVPRVGLILTLTVGMCLFSGLLAVRKALSADPAELF